MDYATFAIVFWIVATAVIAIAAKKSVFKHFKIPQNKIFWMDWRAYMVCAMMLGALVSIGFTSIIRAIF